MGIRSFIKRQVKVRLQEQPPTTAAVNTQPLPAAPDAAGFRAVLAQGALADGTARTIAMDGQAIAVYAVGGRYYATDDACTHEDGPLGEGTLDGTIVQCPYHDWRFDITTGACLTDSQRPIGCFATKIVDGFIWVGPRQTQGSQDRGGIHDDGLKMTEAPD